MFLRIVHARELAWAVGADESVAQGDDFQLTLWQRTQVKSSVIPYGCPGMPFGGRTLWLLARGPDMSDNAALAHGPRNGIVKPAMNPHAGFEFHEEFVRLPGRGSQADHRAEPGRSLGVELEGAKGQTPSRRKLSCYEQIRRGANPKVRRRGVEA